MSIDDIIEYFEKTGALGPKGYGLAELQLRTAKLLKAGQAMRDSLGVASYLTLAEGKTFRQAEVGDNKLAVESIEAWDAATTKEDV